MAPNRDPRDSEGESSEGEESSGEDDNLSVLEWNFEEELCNIVRKYPGCSLKKSENGTFILRGPKYNPQYKCQQHHLPKPSDRDKNRRESITRTDRLESGAPGGALHLQFKNIKGSVMSYDVSSVLSHNDLETKDEKQIRRLFKGAMAKEKGVMWVKINLI